MTASQKCFSKLCSAELAMQNGLHFFHLKTFLFECEAIQSLPLFLEVKKIIKSG